MHLNFKQIYRVQIPYKYHPSLRPSLGTMACESPRTRPHEKWIAPSDDLNCKQLASAGRCGSLLIGVFRDQLTGLQFSENGLAAWLCVQHPVPLRIYSLKEHTSRTSQFESGSLLSSCRLINQKLGHFQARVPLDQHLWHISKLGKQIDHAFNAFPTSLICFENVLDFGSSYSLSAKFRDYLFVAC